MIAVLVLVKRRRKMIFCGVMGQFAIGSLGLAACCIYGYFDYWKFMLSGISSPYNWAGLLFPLAGVMLACFIGFASCSIAMMLPSAAASLDE
ncbi:hypothetical protein [Persicirhabdus sediminis]|uniref:Uncharacterized protein n=1 Tax=Persicirhabdus sediminis TaxID=454144 RepID=A0A8J7MGL5_9BACT|nr:hypothetical protein [Persicirhabdus sediminis]MBK1792560.1 hypothetical protein [Persicirhabdus sediminis]